MLSSISGQSNAWAQTQALRTPPAPSAAAFPATASAAASSLQSTVTKAGGKAAALSDRTISALMSASGSAADAVSRHHRHHAGAAQGSTSQSGSAADASDTGSVVSAMLGEDDTGSDASPGGMLHQVSRAMSAYASQVTGAASFVASTAFKAVTA